MKIEKISNSQIRCILTGEDLASRQLRLSELAYGSEKARALFRDMMEQAAIQCGFDAENYPLMIEAIPLGSDSIVLIVTKVDNPEELDTRFSNFAPSVKSGSSNSGQSSSTLGQLLDSIRKELGEGSGDRTDGAHPSSGKKKRAAGAKESPQEQAGSLLPAGAQLYTFTTLGSAANAACLAAPVFNGTSALYRDPADTRYYLFLTPSDDTDTAQYTSALSTFSEFGTSEFITPAREQYLREHCEVLCAADAVQNLAELGR